MAKSSQFKLLDKSGNAKWVEGRDASIIWNGKPAHLTLLADISARKQAEEKLQQLTAELEQRVVKRTVELSTANQQLQQEIKGRKRAQETLQSMNEMQKLVVDLSSKFVSLSLDEIDEAIMSALQTVGEYVDADRSFIALVSDNQMTYGIVHEWAAPGITPNLYYHQRDVPVPGKWGWQRFQKGQVINIARLSDLPPEADSLREVMLARRAQSFAVTPLFSGKTLRGFWGISTTTKERMWPESTVNLIRLLGDTFVNALERQRRERRIRESEARFRTVFEQGPLGIALMDMEGRYLTVNKRMCEMYGYSEEELRKRTAFDIVFPGDTEKVMQVAEMIQASEEPFHALEYRHVTKDDRILWASAVVSVIRDEESNPLYAIVMIENITERKQAAAALRESEAKYRILTENSPNGIFLSGMERFLYVNRRLCEIMGFSEDEFLNMVNPVAELFAPEERERVLSYAQARISGEPAPICYETQGLRKDGKVVYLKFTVTPVKFLGKSVLQGTIEDITERKRMEETLRESEERFRSIVENPLVGVYIMDSDMRVVYVNQLLASTLGYTPAEIVGTDALSLTTDETQETVRTTMEARHGGDDSVIHAESVVRRKDGERIIVEAAGMGITDSSGQRQVIGVMADITERKQAEEAQRAEQIERERHALTQTLLNTAMTLTSTLDLEQIIDKMLIEVEKVVPSDWTSVVLVDHGRTILAGNREPQLTQRLDDSYHEQMNNACVPYLQQMGETQQQIIVPDVTADSHWDTGNIAEAPMRSYLGTPIVLNQDMFGFLNLGSANPNYFTEIHAEHMRLFAYQAATAIQNTRLFEQGRLLSAAAERQRLAGVVKW